jgi:septal ring factor EnvC (AmiA/AmiB activator)
VSIKERKLQTEIKKLHRVIGQQRAEIIHWVGSASKLEEENEYLKKQIADLRELREFDRVKLERLKGMGV